MKKIFLLFIIMIFSFPVIGAPKLSQQQTDKTVMKNLHSAHTFDTNLIKNIKLETTYETLEIQETFGTELSLEIYGNNNLLFPKITETENSLTITSTSKNSTVGDICNIILYLPSEGKFNNIEINTKSKTKNSINISNIKSENITIETINSNISGSFIKGNLNIKSVNGNIDFSDFSTTNSSFLSKNGQISLKNAEFTKISVNSQSKIIKTHNVTGEYICFINDSGDISADNLSIDFFDIKTISGNISLSFTEGPEASSHIETKTGFVQIFLPENINFDLIAHSNSGTLFDKISKVRLTPRHDYIKSFNEGGPVLSIKTFSGDIEVDKY